MAQEFGVSAGYFVVELDGVAAMEATEVTGVETEMEPYEIIPGTRDTPIYGRGKRKTAPVTVKNATALNNAGREMFQWLNDFAKGIAVERRNMRIVQLGEDGRTPVVQTDLIECIPTKFALDDYKGDAKEGHMFSFTVQPSDFDHAA